MFDEWHQEELICLTLSFYCTPTAILLNKDEATEQSSAMELIFCSLRPLITCSASTRPFIELCCMDTSARYHVSPY
jgi:hypothetical protein